MEKIGVINGKDYLRERYVMDVDLNVQSVREVINSFRRVNDDLQNISFSNTEEYSDYYHRTFPRFRNYNGSGIEPGVRIEKVRFDCINKENIYSVSIDIDYNTVDVIYTSPINIDIFPVLNEAEDNIKKNSMIR